MRPQRASASGRRSGSAAGRKTGAAAARPRAKPARSAGSARGEEEALESANALLVADEAELAADTAAARSRSDGDWDGLLAGLPAEAKVTLLLQRLREAEAEAKRGLGRRRRLQRELHDSAESLR